MELARQQKLLARLATQREFREQFFADPARVAASEGLTVAAESLARLSHEQVKQLSRVLRRRRLGQVGVQLPLTRKALGPLFSELFRNYAVHPVPGPRAWEDALGFARFIEKHAQEHGIEPAWAVSLARYEATQLEATWQRPKYLFRTFPHAVKKLAAFLTAGEVPPGEHRKFTPALWWRPAVNSRLGHWLR